MRGRFLLPVRLITILGLSEVRPQVLRSTDKSGREAEEKAMVGVTPRLASDCSVSVADVVRCGFLLLPSKAKELNAAAKSLKQARSRLPVVCSRTSLSAPSP